MNIATADIGLLRAPKRAKSIVEDIAGQLRKLILQGRLAPGTRLVELEIAAQMGSSQGSVREALQRLERDALVERQGRRGTFVTNVSPEDMREVFLVRSAVESAAIRRTARRIQDDQLDELTKLVQSMREAAREGEPAALVALDMLFHQRICAWAEHPTLLRIWMLLRTQVERFLILFDPVHFPDLSQVADNHLPLLEALAARDPDLAADRMEQHVMIGVQAADFGKRSLGKRKNRG